MDAIVIGNIQKNHDILAQSEALPPVEFTINASADAGGSISPSGAVTVAQGGLQRFVSEPAIGFRIIGWLVDGVFVPVSADGSDVMLSD